MFIFIFLTFCFAVDPSTGILNIRNVSQFMFGTYQCNASNVVGFSICTIELNSGNIRFCVCVGGNNVLHIANFNYKQFHKYILFLLCSESEFQHFEMFS